MTDRYLSHLLIFRLRASARFLYNLKAKIFNSSSSIASYTRYPTLHASGMFHYSIASKTAKTVKLVFSSHDLHDSDCTKRRIIRRGRGRKSAERERERRKTASNPLSNNKLHIPFRRVNLSHARVLQIWSIYTYSSEKCDEAYMCIVGLTATQYHSFREKLSERLDKVDAEMG